MRQLLEYVTFTSSVLGLKHTTIASHPSAVIYFHRLSPLGRVVHETPAESERLHSCGEGAHGGQGSPTDSAPGVVGRF